MADDHRHGNGLLRPGVPLVDVQVGAADARSKHLDEHVVDADRWDGGLVQPEALLRFLLDQGGHGLHGGGLSGTGGAAAVAP